MKNPLMLKAAFRKMWISWYFTCILHYFQLTMWNLNTYEALN